MSDKWDITAYHTPQDTERLMDCPVCGGPVLDEEYYGAFEGELLDDYAIYVCPCYCHIGFSKTLPSEWGDD